MKARDIDHLMNMMDIGELYNSKVHPKSIMKFGKICECDDDFLCKHRRKIIIEFIKSKC